jgi:hydroxymethylglutaryl-CoA lyase
MTGGLPPRTTVVEVGPRDGFQVESTFIPTELKVDVINQLSASGLRKIEATSFVNPRVIPQMRDAAEVMARITRVPGVVYTALVPNLRGALTAMDAGVDAVRLVICVTETYNQRNVGMSVAESVAALERIHQAAEGRGVPVEVVVALAFGCPLEGEVREPAVVALAERVAQLGVLRIAVADSVGFAHPGQVASLLHRLRTALPAVRWAIHLHDTRGMGIANTLAALGAGVDEVDAALGGLGGCPVVPGATGNVATEDLVHMLDELGVATGVNVEQVMAASRLLQQFLLRSLPSRVLQVGTRAAAWRRAPHSPLVTEHLQP